MIIYTFCQGFGFGSVGEFGVPNAVNIEVFVYHEEECNDSENTAHYVKRNCLNNGCY